MTSEPVRPEPLLDRSRAATVLIGVVMAAAAGSLWADLAQLDLLNRVADGARIGLAEAQDADDRVATMALIYTVASILSAITFLLWYSRAYRNIAALGVSRPRWGRGWAVGYWFIPIANLFRPKQVMNDIWRGSDPQLSVNTANLQNLPVNPLLHWWWAAWLLSGWISNFAIRRAFDDQAPTIDNLQAQATGYVVTDVADLVVGVLAILVIRSITARQEERRRLYEEGAIRGQAPTTADADPGAAQAGASTPANP